MKREICIIEAKDAATDDAIHARLEGRLTATHLKLNAIKNHCRLTCKDCLPYFGWNRLIRTKLYELELYANLIWCVSSSWAVLESCSPSQACRARNSCWWLTLTPGGRHSPSAFCRPAFTWWPPVDGTRLLLSQDWVQNHRLGASAAR